jgi:2-desacetyl-2-hydroxyethyl bacteriochlorophyllide A dehydrogenase
MVGGFFMIVEKCVITGVRKTELQKVEIPDREPQEHEILLETHYSLTSPGTETAGFSGLEPDVFVPGAWCAYPWNSGYIAVGRVLKAAKNRWGYKPGDLVMAQAPHSSHNWVHTEHSTTVAVPKGMDLKDACYTSLVEISLTSVQVSTVKKGDPVVVIGLGPVGNFAAQLFREQGARVAGMDPAAHRRDLAQKMGISLVLNSGTVEENKKSIREAFGEEARIVVEAVGDATLITQAMQYVRHGDGEVILLGTPRKETVMDIRKVFHTIHREGIRMVGAHLYVNPAFPTEGNPHSIFGNLAQMIGWIKEGKVLVKPLISHVLHPSKIQQAYEGLLDKREEYTGVVLDWTKKAP